VVVCESQVLAGHYIPVAELWPPFNFGSLDKGIFVVIVGYIDESYDGKKIPSTFSLTCTVATGSEWPYIELAWLKCLEEKNASLLRQGRKPISRYHSRDINNFHGDFADWTGSERKEFCEKLIKVFSHHDWGYEGYAVNLKEVVEKWPEYESDPFVWAYEVLLKFIMHEIGKGVVTEVPDYTVTLFHERCAYDGVLLEAFNQLINDPGFAYKHVFTTIAPIGWERCIPLQPADLVAYENFKEVHRAEAVKEGDKERPRRLIFSELISLDSFVPHLKQLTRENIADMRKFRLQRR
jgi:hypothetical protein